MFIGFCTLTRYCIAPVNSIAWDPTIEPPRCGAAIGAHNRFVYVAANVHILDLSPLFRSFVLV